MFSRAATIIWILIGTFSSLSGQDLAALRRTFVDPPDFTRPMMRWWWFGPSVTDAEIDRELRAMKDAGLGGVEIQPVYPLQLEGNVPYLSADFKARLHHAAVTAQELGLRFDITLGSGWPWGGPHITPDLGAQRLRWRPWSKALDVPTAQRLAAYRVVNGQVQRIALADLPPEGDLAITLAYFEPTRQMVKRAAVGAEGLVVDHYNRRAIETHLHAVGDPLLEAAGASRVYAMFLDSLEVFGADWTRDLPAEFQKRRGYDLLDHLTDLWRETTTSSITRRDYGQTLTELLEDNTLKPFAEWCNQHGVKARGQIYGTPPARISSARLIDLSEGEGLPWNSFNMMRWASSPRPTGVVSSETWTYVHSPIYRATPLDLKVEADQHFLSGINQLIGHGWPYSPPGSEPLRWTFYAAGALNERNPWWPVMPDVMRTLTRSSALLRQGHRANTVALYLPNDAGFAGLTPSNVYLNRSLQKIIDPQLLPSIL